MRIGSVAVAGVLLLGALLAPAAMAYDESEYLKAAETILCDCGCHPQSVADCACGRAAELPVDGPVGLGQAPAFDGGKVFPNRIHFMDGSATGQEDPAGRLFVGQRQSVARQGQ